MYLYVYVLFTRCCVHVACGRPCQTTSLIMDSNFPMDSNLNLIAGKQSEISTPPLGSFFHPRRSPTSHRSSVALYCWNRNDLEWYCSRLHVTIVLGPDEDFCPLHIPDRYVSGKMAAGLDSMIFVIHRSFYPAPVVPKTHPDIGVPALSCPNTLCSLWFGHRTASRSLC